MVNAEKVRKQKQTKTKKKKNSINYKNKIHTLLYTYYISRYSKN